MKTFLRRLSLAFAAGAVGGLANGFAVWGAVRLGLPALAHVRIGAPPLPGGLYPRVVWGGVWGLLLLLPVLERRPVWRGLVLSLGPTLAQLFWFYPHATPNGPMGLRLGWLTPLFVVVFNAVWGVVASLWYRRTA